MTTADSMENHPPIGPLIVSATGGAELRALDHAVESASVHGDVRPVAFDGCLGWVHVAQGVLKRAAAVVIVNGVGRDARCAHRPLRLLAEELAAGGFTVLRYDHPGQGDSLDPADDIDQFHAWQAGVGQAVRALEAATGLSRISVVGLRLGASLAALECEGVDSQVLLAPVVDGRQWVRELKLAGRMSATYSEGEGKGFETEGVSLPDDCVRAIQGLDLTAVHHAAPDILLAMPGGDDAALITALTGSGARVEPIGFDDFEGLFIDAHSNITPVRTFAAVTDWLGARYPMTPLAPPVELPAAAVLHPPLAVETAVTFGAGLKGVICAPEAPDHQGKAVIFCNTGGDPRAGIGNFAAGAARRLALDGIASLRFDFAGLGDSQAPRDGESHAFTTSREADFDAAITLMQGLGYADITLMGICSGSFHALAAAQADPRVTRLLVVNPIKLSWAPGDSVAALYRELGKSTRSYLQATSSADTWKRLFSGAIDLRAVGRTLANRAINQAPNRARTQQIRAVRRGVAAMAKRGVKGRFMVGLMDGCLDEVERHFGRQGKLLDRLGMGLVVHDDLDHGLAMAASRRKALDVLIDFVEG